MPLLLEDIPLYDTLPLNLQWLPFFQPFHTRPSCPHSPAAASRWSHPLFHYIPLHRLQSPWLQRWWQSSPGAGHSPSTKKIWWCSTLFLSTCQVTTAFWIVWLVGWARTTEETNIPGTLELPIWFCLECCMSEAWTSTYLRVTTADWVCKPLWE